MNPNDLKYQRSDGKKALANSHPGKCQILYLVHTNA